jgi:deoxycytidylate deaminase
MKDKFIKKYMRLAKLVGEDQNPCYSRSIGVVVVDPVANRVLGTGYNGPPKGVPHPDDPDYLDKIVWPQLTKIEKRTALVENGHINEDDFEIIHDDDQKNIFLKVYSNCKKCPRKIVGAQSGERLELCSCEHGEKNAIVNSGQNLYGAWMFCWCGVPCWDCTKLIINSGIKKVFCFEWGKDYSMGSRWLFENAEKKNRFDYLR